MNRQMQQWQPPHGREDAALVRGGREGLYWQANDGLVVRVAAAERAVDANDDVRRPEQVQQMQREVSGAIGPAGLAVALWVRLFAPAA
jgi:hypothetical protein